MKIQKKYDFLGAIPAIIIAMFIAGISSLTYKTCKQIKRDNYLFYEATPDQFDSVLRYEYGEVSVDTIIGSKR